MKNLILCALIGLVTLTQFTIEAKPQTKTEFCKCDPCKCNPCTCGIKCECCKSDKDCQDCSCKCTQGAQCSCTSGDKSCCNKNS